MQQKLQPWINENHQKAMNQILWLPLPDLFLCFFQIFDLDCFAIFSSFHVKLLFHDHCSWIQNVRNDETESYMCQFLIFTPVPLRPSSSSSSSSSFSSYLYSHFVCEAQNRSKQSQVQIGGQFWLGIKNDNLIGPQNQRLEIVYSTLCRNIWKIFSDLWA